jgi:tRNA modification GTPase
MKQVDDTIAAIATPIGVGGIAVIRVSGRTAIEVVAESFRGKSKLTAARSHTVHHGTFVGSDGGLIDEVVVTVFRAPTSYTGEDVVEISCHGGIFVTRELLNAVIATGARHAEPGEFTKRAFLNGRIDLSQAEAVADLIQARSATAHRSSIDQLSGNLGRRLKEMSEEVKKVCGLVELELDFAEEGIELISKESVEDEISRLARETRELAQTFRYGRFYRNGVRVVLIGRPNVGKSSILNAVLMDDRAIVTDIPGTTRDVIEESISIRGMLFRLIDTAGIRETNDIIETEGVRRSKAQIRQADICAYVVDSSEVDSSLDVEFIREVRETLGARDKKSIIIYNKIDLLDDFQLTQFSRRIDSSISTAYVSAHTGKGIGGLKQALFDICEATPLAAGQDTVVTSERHFDLLNRSSELLEMALGTLRSGGGGEKVALDLRKGLGSIGEITGEVTTEDILNEVFSKFCIGK